MLHHCVQALRLAGATIVDNFTIGGNSLGALSWDGRLGEWYTGYGLQGHWEEIQCDRFRADINTYLGGAYSRYKDIQVGSLITCAGVAWLNSVLLQAQHV